MSGNTKRQYTWGNLPNLWYLFWAETLQSHFCQHLGSRFFGFNGQDQKTRAENNVPKQLMRELTKKNEFKLSAFPLTSDCFVWLHKLLNSDWPANVLAGFKMQAQENGLMSPDGVCAISTGPAGHKTTQQSVQRTCFSCMKFIEHLTSLVHLIQAFMSESYLKLIEYLVLSVH